MKDNEKRIISLTPLVLSSTCILYWHKVALFYCQVGWKLKIYIILYFQRLTFEMTKDK